MTHAAATEVSDAALLAIADELGLPTATWVSHHSVGTSNTIYTLGDTYVLKVPRQHAPTIAAVGAETVAARAAHAAGVQTPAVVFVDDSLTLLPVPYAVYERVPGVPLAVLPPDTAGAAVWHALGCDLARLHSGVPQTVPLSGTVADAAHDNPRPWLDDLHQSGMIGPADAAWLHTWLDRLLAPTRERVPACFCHGDVNAGNIIVSSHGDTYRALVDWGGAGWGDAAYDFAVVSLAAVPLLIGGYGTIAPLPGAATLEARILWFHLTMAIWGLRFGPVRDRAWIAERLARLRRQTHAFVVQATSLAGK